MFKLWMVSINLPNEVGHTTHTLQVAGARHTSKWGWNLIHRFTDNKKLTITGELQDFHLQSN